MPSPWDTSYTYTTPGYANYAGANRGATFTPFRNASVNVPATIAGGMIPYAGLTGQVNQLMTDEVRRPFEANLPDYSNLVSQRSRNTGSLLRGEVPQDVTNQIIQQGAERGISTGSPGSPNANAAWLKALGLTSLGLQQQGSQQLSQSISDTPIPQLFNPASLFVPQTLAADSLNAAQAGLRNSTGTNLNSGWNDNRVTWDVNWDNFGF